MKQAEHCGFSSMPQLNQTGLLKEAFCSTRRWQSSASKLSASSGEAKYPPFRPHLEMVSTTLPTSCLTLLSRPLPSLERRKYFETTTFVANIDQVLGTSTSGCSKMTSPFSLVITAFRFSHLT